MTGKGNNSGSGNNTGNGPNASNGPFGGVTAGSNITGCPLNAIAGVWDGVCGPAKGNAV